MKDVISVHTNALNDKDMVLNLDEVIKTLTGKDGGELSSLYYGDSGDLREAILQSFKIVDDFFIRKTTRDNKYISKLLEERDKIKNNGYAFEEMENIYERNIDKRSKLLEKYNTYLTRANEVLGKLNGVIFSGNSLPPLGE